MSDEKKLTTWGTMPDGSKVEIVAWGGGGGGGGGGRHDGASTPDETVLATERAIGAWLRANGHAKAADAVDDGMWRPR